MTSVAPYMHNRGSSVRAFPEHTCSNKLSHSSMFNRCDKFQRSKVTVYHSDVHGLLELITSYFLTFTGANIGSTLQRNKDSLSEDCGNLIKKIKRIFRDDINSVGTCETKGKRVTKLVGRKGVYTHTERQVWVKAFENTPIKAPSNDATLKKCGRIDGISRSNDEISEIIQEEINFFVSMYPEFYKEHKKVVVQALYGEKLPTIKPKSNDQVLPIKELQEIFWYLRFLRQVISFEKCFPNFYKKYQISVFQFIFEELDLLPNEMAENKEALKMLNKIRSKNFVIKEVASFKEKHHDFYVKNSKVILDLFFEEPFVNFLDSIPKATSETIIEDLMNTYWLIKFNRDYDSLNYQLLDENLIFKRDQIISDLQILRTTFDDGSKEFFKKFSEISENNRENYKEYLRLFPNKVSKPSISCSC